MESHFISVRMIEKITVFLYTVQIHTNTPFDAPCILL